MTLRNILLALLLLLVCGIPILAAKGRQAGPYTVYLEEERGDSDLVIRTWYNCPAEPSLQGAGVLVVLSGGGAELHPLTKGRKFRVKRDP